MCGVFAFIANGTSGPHPRTLERIATATQRRGPHAFGFAWIDSRGRLRMFKQAGKITDHLGLLRLAADARLLVGHCRYATSGDPEENINNHPHPCNGGWLVHNGVIPRHEAWLRKQNLSPVSACDSEALALAIETSNGPLLRRFIRATKLAHTSPLVTLGLWRAPGRLLAVRRGNPLHHGQDAQGWYLASLSEDLPDAAPVPNDSALSITLRRSGPQLRQFDLPLPRIPF